MEQIELTAQESETAIASTFNVLKKRLSASAENTKIRRVGFKGGNVLSTLHWNPLYGFWVVLDKNQVENHHWIAFGLENPFESKRPTLLITCEINSPKTGIDRRCGGLYASDNEGKQYLLSRGKLAGGRKGIGKHGFLNSLRSRGFNAFIDVKFSNNKINECIVIGDIDSQSFIVNLSNYLKEVDIYKRSIFDNAQENTADDLFTNEVTNAFSPEYEGPISYSVSSVIERNNLHGRVVNQLNDKINENYGSDFERSNSIPCDLILLDRRNKNKYLFEIKTIVSTSDLYKALGQLLFHGHEIKAFKRIMVLPQEYNTLFSSYIEVIKKLDIHILYYSISLLSERQTINFDLAALGKLIDNN